MRRGNTEVRSGLINAVSVLTDETGKNLGFNKATRIVEDFKLSNLNDVLTLKLTDYEVLRREKKLKGVTKKDIETLKRYC
jgi:hypothetical protein